MRNEHKSNKATVILSFKNPVKEPDTKPPEKILIRTPNWLGDLMMSTAFVQKVLQSFPNARVDLIVKKGFETLPLPCRGKILPFDKKSISAFRFGKGLRGYSYDRIYVLPPSFSSALMAFAAKIPERIGYQGELRGLLLNKSKRYLKQPRSQHLVTEYTQLLDGLEQEELVYPYLSIDNDWIEQHISRIPANLPESYITIAPGAIYGPAKQWPITHYRSLAQLICRQNLGVAVIGTNADKDAGNRITEGIDNAIDLCGVTNLNQMIAVLANSQLLVSNDSGTMHVMAALQKPQVAIFGSTSTTWTGPLNKQANIIKKPFECSPCFKRKCPYGHYDCLNSISADEVFDNVKALLV